MNVGGLVTRWVSAIFILILIPVYASISVCDEVECYPVSNQNFLQLDQPQVMEEITYKYPFACDILNMHPLGVFSWIPDLIIGPHCDGIKSRETLKYLIGVSVREDFENFASSSSPIDVKFSSDKKHLSDWPTINQKVSDLENSISNVEIKNLELKKSIEKFNEYKARGLSGCSGLIESSAKGFVKQGKKTAISSIKKWGKEASK